jgi:hypothetical protein
MRLIFVLFTAKQKKLVYIPFIPARRLAYMFFYFVSIFD